MDVVAAAAPPAARLSAVEFEDVLAAAKLTQHAEAFRKVGFADARDLVSATTATTRLDSALMAERCAGGDRRRAADGAGPAGR